MGRLNPGRYRILFIPFITILVMMIAIFIMVIFNIRSFSELMRFAGIRVGYVLGNAFVSVSIFYFVVNWFNTWLVWSKRWLVRLMMDVLLVALYSMLLVFVGYIAQKQGWVIGPHDTEIKEFFFVIPIMANTLFLVMIELILAMEERNKLVVQLAQMEKEQAIAKYGALKEQLDHHFLFNNLSVLSSLIYEDVEKADKFIQDFADTYRYVLQINQRHLVTIQEEIDFIGKYLHLLKFRFESGFSFQIKVDEDKLKWQIPPLTLQVLVENAIKHNMVSRQFPLHLSIEADGYKLIVKNNLQSKMEPVVSTQKGQINLVEKYRLLGVGLPEFIQDSELYVVKIPLIEPDQIG